MYCFFCGVGIENWDVGEAPWEGHALFKPFCGFLRSVKDDQYIRSVHGEYERLEGKNNCIHHRSMIVFEKRKTNFMLCMKICDNEI